MWNANKTSNAIPNLGAGTGQPVIKSRKQTVAIALKNKAKQKASFSGGGGSAVSMGSNKSFKI